MAAQEWDWFQREELIGQISDIRVQNLQVERENVQKRTFTRWINVHLEKCNPPLEVTDLFIDIQDGKVLMALLEVLSGSSLLHEYKSSSHRIFRLNNIAKALKFLEDSNVKLVSIDAAEIADGNPSLILGLIWNIILFFQIKELTGNLSRSSPSSSLSPSSGGTDSDSSYPPTPTTERSAAISVKDQRKAIKTLLAWVQRKTRKYGVAVQDFAGSWRSGLAFLAVIKTIDPSLVDMKQALEESTRENLEKAFSIAHDALHIPRLLEPEDIMVDTPDEHSIVTYVAQFLERFPELEPEEFMDPDKEVPIESTFVHIKDSPSEQESRILFLTENGERTCTVNHETSHPPPAKVFVCDQPESTKDLCLCGVSSQALSDSSTDSATEFMHQIFDEVLPGSQRKTSTSSEPAPEPSILSRKDGRRSNSLPIKKTVHFETDTHKDTTCSKDCFFIPDLRSEGIPRASKEPLRKDGPKSLVEIAEEKKPEQEAWLVQETASDKIPRDTAGTDGTVHRAPPPQDSSFCNGSVESPAGCGEDSLPPPFGENTVVADSSELRVLLLAVETMDNEDYFEGVPLKASKFNKDLANFASTSQTRSEAYPGRNDGFQNYAENLGKRKAHAEMELPEPHMEPKAPEQEGEGYWWPLGESSAEEKPKPYEKAKRKSSRRSSEDDGETKGLPKIEEELLSNPPSASISLETLGSPSEECLALKPSPPLSKISLIPHNLFYYPHYEVPLATVLEAYEEGGEDLKSENAEAQEPEPGGCSHDLDSREEKAHSSWSSSFPMPGDSQSSASDQASLVNGGDVGVTPASGPTAPAPHENHQPGETRESGPVESQQPQRASNSEHPASQPEEKVPEESTSSKKKEKRKHMDHVESSFIAPEIVRSWDELEEDPCENKIPSRTSHSDSSICIRRHTNRSLELDHFSYAQLRNAAKLDDKKNPILNRYTTRKLIELILQLCGIEADTQREFQHARMSMKVFLTAGEKDANLGEAMALGSQIPSSDSLTQFFQQPDAMYFVLFLWLLVYCLLLFPQLDISQF